MARATFLIAIWLLAAFPRWGSALQLVLWRPNRVTPPLVMGVRAGETPRAAALRYLVQLQVDPEMRSLLQLSSPLPSMTLQSSFTQLTDDDFASRALLIANRPQDYAGVGNWRIASFATPLRRTGGSVYMVPFAADLGLNPEESEEFIAALDRRFPSMVAMGGDDIDLRLLGYSIEGSQTVNGRRDLFEMRLLQRKIQRIRARLNPMSPALDNWLPPHLQGASRQDRLLGICRGAQFVGVLMGLEIVTHIDGHGGHSEILERGNGASAAGQILGERLHPLELHQTSKGVIAGFFRDHEGEIDTNTYHHQCLRKVRGSVMQTASTNPDDGCVEGIESDDGAIVGVQGHPELMAMRNHGRAQRNGERMMRRIAEWLMPMAGDCQLGLAAE